MALSRRTLIGAGALGLTAGAAVASAAPPASGVPGAGEPIVIGRRLELHSRIVGGVRSVRLRLPDPERARSGPVTLICVLDAENFFESVCAAAGFVERSRLSRSRAVAVAGVDALPETRTHDLTPTASRARRDGTIDPQAPAEGGGAADYLRLLTREVLPLARERLPEGVRIGRRALFGHSYGGLFTLNVLRTAPYVFDDYVAVDPSLWWDRRRMLTEWVRAAEGALSGDLCGRRLWLGFATKPRRARDGSRPAVTADPLVPELVERLKFSGAEVFRRNFDEETHGTVMPVAIPLAMRALYLRPAV